MGMFDTVLLRDGRTLQVKCWGRDLREYRPGDKVSLVDYFEDGSVVVTGPGSVDYQVAVKGGLFLNVFSGALFGISDQRREDLVLLDNQGRVFGAEHNQTAWISGPDTEETSVSMWDFE